jgi:hypothetical protein
VAAVASALAALAPTPAARVVAGTAGAGVLGLALGVAWLGPGGRSTVRLAFAPEPGRGVRLGVAR